MRVRRWGTGSLMAAAAVVALTGCGGSGGDGGGKTEIAAAGGKPSASASAKSGLEGELAEYVEGRRKWVACMREQGVDLPDPDAKGHVEIGVDNKEWKSNPTMLKAQEKCADLQPAIPDDLEKSMQPAPTRKEIEERKRYAACMQENGAPDFPDVGEDGNYLEESWDAAADGAQRASRTCDKEVFGIDPDAITPKG